MIQLLLKLRFWFLALFGRSGKNDDLDQELGQHIELQIAEYESQGLSPKEARNEALKEFGNVESLKEECRDVWGIRVIMNLIRDFRYLARSLWKSKGFSLAVIITLALCIGANTTILSALHDLVLRPLPFKDGNRLVRVFNVSSGSKGKSSESSYAQYDDFKAHADLFDGFFLMRDTEKSIDQNGVTKLLIGKSVTYDLFRLANVRPVIGSFFGEEAQVADQHRVMVLPQTVWENEYDSSPDVIGRVVPFVDGSYTIVGVAPRSLEAFAYGTRFFIPMDLSPGFMKARYLEGLPFDLWGRLQSGVSEEAGKAQLETLETHWLNEVAPQRVRSYLERIGRGVELGRPSPLEESFIMLQVGALFVLLIGCVNVVNLLLSRAGKKRHELSVRNAVGAGRVALSRLMLIESLILAVAAATAGVALSMGGLMLINRYLAVADPSIPPITVDWIVILSILGLTGFIALVMGLLPISLLFKVGAIDKDSSSRNASAGGVARRLSGSMVVSQVVIAFILVIGAGLLLRSFINIMSIDPGFDADKVVQARVTVPREYRKSLDGDSFRDRVSTAILEVPGVEGVAFTRGIPVGGKDIFLKEQVHLQSLPYVDGEPAAMLYVQAVSQGFFEMMGIPLVDGRSFDASDREDERHYTGYIVDESFAEFFFPRRSPVGEGMALSQKPRNGRPWSPIIGVVGRANLVGLESRDDLPILYKPFRGSKVHDFTLLVRTVRPEGSILREVQSKLRVVDPKLVLHDASSLERVLENLLVNRRGALFLLVAFAGLALLLSAIGLYGLLSYDVQQRQREIGIRVAIGATKSEVLAMVLKEGLWKALVGLVLGVFGSLYFARFLESRLFDISALDPWTYFVAISFLLSVALVACYLPARRAARLDPVEVMRTE